MIGFYRTHIKRFSVIAAPLYARLGTKLPFRFSLSESDRGRFADLKRLVTSPPVLAHPDFKRTFIIVVDGACKEGLAGSLSQVGPDGIRPIAFASRLFFRPSETIRAIKLHVLVLLGRVVISTRRFTAHCLF